jgi:hypothetical protein
MIHDETDRRPLMVRLPDAIKTWIEEKAAQDERSQNSVIVRTLRGVMDHEQREREKAAG